MACRGHRLHALPCIVAVVVTSLGVLLHAGSAAAAPGLLVGASDDMFKLEPGRANSFAEDLGLTSARVTLWWQAGRTALTGTEAAQLQAAASTRPRIVLAVNAWADASPQTDAARDAYCSFLRDALVQVPRINDVVLWNEPNLPYFWWPQFDETGRSVAPAAYEQLLARCWDVLHAYRPSVNVIAFALSPWGSDDATGTTVSHSPGNFIEKVGDAYRASGRTAPIFDTVSHHIYGVTPAERPWASHPFSSRRISEGDIGRLVGVLQTAFAGTAQAVPGAPVGGRTAPIWYLESGFETIPTPEKLPFYTGSAWGDAIPDFAGSIPWVTLPTGPAPDQATQLRDALRLAYCQPYVGALLNFQLQDEPDLNRWQSGVLWADGTPKRSYDSWRNTIAEVNAHAVDCSLFGGAGGAVIPTDEGDAPASLTLTPTPPVSPSGPVPEDLPPRSGGADAPRSRTPAPSAKPTRLVIAWLRRVRGRYTHRNRAWIVSIRANARASFTATIETAGGIRRLQRRGKLAVDAPTRIEFSRRPLNTGTYRVVVRARGFALRSTKFRVR